MKERGLYRKLVLWGTPGMLNNYKLDIELSSLTQLPAVPATQEPSSHGVTWGNPDRGSHTLRATNAFTLISVTKWVGQVLRVLRTQATAFDYLGDLWSITSVIFLHRLGLCTMHFYPFHELDPLITDDALSHSMLWEVDCKDIKSRCKHSDLILCSCAFRMSRVNVRCIAAVHWLRAANAQEQTKSWTFRIFPNAAHHNAQQCAVASLGGGAWPSPTLY